jgi:alpha-1,6-mannosyltransferase
MAVRVVLGVMVVAAFLLVAGAAAYRGGPMIRNHYPFSPELRGLLGGLKLGVSRVEFGVLLGLLTACYLAVTALAGSLTKRAAIGSIVLLHVLFAIAPPLLSSDIFNYVGYARLEVVHHINAYEFPLLIRPTDEIYRYVGWPANTTAYGPLFTMMSLPLGLIGSTAAVWVVKATAALSSLGCVALVWSCAKRLGRDPVAAALFVGLNPLLLVFAVGGGHNDLVMMLLALAGVTLLLAGRRAGMVGLVAAAAVKLSAGILIPFAILGSRQRWRSLLVVLAASALALIGAVLVFGLHLLTIREVLGKDSQLATPNNVPGFLFNDVLGLGLSQGLQAGVGMAVLAVALVFLLVRVYRGGDWLAAAGWATFAVLASTTWLLPWYIVWWLPLAALLRSSSQRIAAMALTVFIVALQMPLIVSPA